MLTQLVALSGEDAEAEALVLTAPKLSGRLGPVKAAAAVGTSVTSDVLRLHAASPPVHGLRCAVVAHNIVALCSAILMP